MAIPNTRLSQSSSDRDGKLKRNRKLVLAGQIAFLPTGVLTTLLGPMLPILIARWSMNDAQAGNLFLVQFLATLAGVQLSGVLLSRWGFRPALLSGLLLMASGAAMLDLGSLWLGMISVAAYGLGIGLTIPVDSLLIAEIASDSGDRLGVASGAGAVSLLNFFWGVGAVLCSLMVAWTADHKLLPVFLGGVALSLLVLAGAVRNSPFPPRATSAGATASSSWRRLVKNPAIGLFAVVFFLYPGVEAAVGGWIGSYVSRMGARGAAIASMMPALFWSALTAGRAWGTAFLRHCSERGVLRAGYAAGVAGIGLMLWAPALATVIGGALIAGLGFATLYPITVARLSQRFGVAAHSIAPAMFSLAAIGPAIIPWMVGLVSQVTGSLRAGLLVVLSATVVLFLVHLFEW